MGKVARQSPIEGLAALCAGGDTGGRGRQTRSRHTAVGWKHLGRPVFLPATIPLDLRAG